MKKVLIISPHFPPSNLAAVHRSRLFAQHLPSFGWTPIILTVDERFYEEELDWNLAKLLPENLRIEKVTAIKVLKPRLIGDIGLRSFFQLYKKAKKIITSEHIDVLYIPIPSFYSALLGRMLHYSTGVKYGIDYIDPWVHEFPGSQQIFSRHWFSKKLANLLEPLAVKKASLITGVAEGYYEGVIFRNPALKRRCVFGAMPYGGEASDHEAVRSLELKPHLFNPKQNIFQLVYAGAMLPKAYVVLEAIFKAISSNSPFYENVEFHFIGTGKTPNDPYGFNIKPLAQQYGLWNKQVYEYPKRIPYLDVLTHLEAASAVFILGSTEPHYTPSKTYQAVLAKKPILAILNNQSTAVAAVRNAKAGLVLDFEGSEKGVESIEYRFNNAFLTFQTFAKQFEHTQLDTTAFEEYSAAAVTSKLAGLLNKVVTRYL